MLNAITPGQMEEVLVFLDQLSEARKARAAEGKRQTVDEIVDDLRRRRLTDYLYALCDEARKELIALSLLGRGDFDHSAERASKTCASLAKWRKNASARFGERSRMLCSTCERVCAGMSSHSSTTASGPRRRILRTHLSLEDLILATLIAERISSAMRLGESLALIIVLTSSANISVSKCRRSCSDMILLSSAWALGVSLEIAHAIRSTCFKRRSSPPIASA
jgi:Protein of unknown function (DUF3775)